MEEKNDLAEAIKKLKNVKLVAKALPVIIASLPFLMGFFVVFVVVFLVLGLLDGSDSSKLSCHDVASAEAICENVVVKGDPAVSVDEYVAGVVSHEFGGAANYPEMLKAQAIAARSYFLASMSSDTLDSDGNCVISDTSEGFQTYDSNPAEVYLNAAEETSGMVLITDSGSVARSEYSSQALPKPYSSYTGSTVTMCERDLEVPKDWFNANKTCDTSSLEHVNGGNVDAFGRPAYGCGHGRGMGQIAALYLVMEKGYNYEQVLDYFYGQDSEYKYTLASTNGTSNRICTGGNLQTLDNYNLNSAGLNVLSHTLSSSEIDDLNAYIENEVKKAGHGTGASVAAVGQGLVYWLEKNKKAYLGYFWAGGHGGYGNDGNLIGGNPDWGSTKFGVDNHNGNNRPYYGMDCSGFVSWATRNGCNPEFGSDVSGGWNNKGTALKSLSDVEPGDILSNNGHVMLVVHNGEHGVIVAEETGSLGLHFTKDPNPSGYNIRSMKSWYASNCTDIQAGSGGSSSTSSGKGKILLVAGHSYSPYCNKYSNECRGNSIAGYAEETETRKLVQLLKEKLIKQGYKEKDIDIANELLGEKFGDTSTSKSLYGELMDNSSAFQSINFKQYKFAMEIHFNGANGSASGVCTVCTNGDCGISSSINSKIRSAVSSTLGKSDNGVCNISTHTFNHFKSLGIPFTYLETEFYDNKSAMQNYESKKDKLATEIAKVIKKNYP